MLKDKLVDSALEKYGLPRWMKPYIINYLKGNSVGAVKRAVSFVNVGRKKGIITKNQIMLPNGTKFEKEQILRLVSLFFYGEERLGEISSNWAGAAADSNPAHTKHFETMAGIESKRARAIKSMVQVLASKPTEPTKEIVDLYDYIESLKSWNERLIAKNIILYNSFAMPLGYVFYKVFYPVSPEFMRSFGTAFSNRDEEEVMSAEEACNIVRNKTIENQRLMLITENILSRVARSVDAEMKDAKRAGVEREAILLKDVAVAFPLHKLKELGVNIDVDKEVVAIKRIAKSGKAGTENKRNG